MVPLVLPQVVIIKMQQKSIFHLFLLIFPFPLRISRPPNTYLCDMLLYKQELHLFSVPATRTFYVTSYFSTSTPLTQQIGGKKWENKETWQRVPPVAHLVEQVPHVSGSCPGVQVQPFAVCHCLLSLSTVKKSTIIKQNGKKNKQINNVTKRTTIQNSHPVYMPGVHR